MNISNSCKLICSSCICHSARWVFIKEAIDTHPISSFNWIPTPARFLLHSLKWMSENLPAEKKLLDRMIMAWLVKKSPSQKRNYLIHDYGGLKPSKVQHFDYIQWVVVVSVKVLVQSFFKSKSCNTN